MSCVGFAGTDFTIKVEAKGNFENSPKSQTFCMWWVFYIVCLYVLSNIGSH